jgi:hypothetical protein
MIRPRIFGLSCLITISTCISPLIDLLETMETFPSSVVFYNATYNYDPTVSAVTGYEEVSLLSVLAGHSNRNSPQLLLNLEIADAYWLARMSQPGAWLSNTTFETIYPPIENLVNRMIESAGIKGVVVFDPSVTCTSAIANTASAAENLLPIAFRPSDPTSLYSRLVLNGPKLSVLRNLVGMFNGNISGSVKRDAYTWAVNEFIVSNKTDARNLGYYVDYFWTTNPGNTENGNGWSKATISNIDYVVAQRGFFFDLGVWDDEAPVDEPLQPLGSDLAAFRYMLSAAVTATNGQDIIRMRGFTPWAYKYVSPHGKHGGVEAEWATCKIISAYNTLDDGDACCIGNMANAAFWSLAPISDRYIQAPPPSKNLLQQKGYINSEGSVVGNRLYYMFYQGDFDSAAWVYSQLMTRWDDPARGQVPIGWPIDAGLASRFPLVWPILFGTQNAENDTLITGDSGAGYLNPTMLYGDARRNESGLSDGLEPWRQLNEALNRQFNIRFTGFSISGDAPQPTAFDDAFFSNFSSFGVVNQGWPKLEAYLNGNTPILTQWDIAADVPTASATISSYVKSSQSTPTWMMFRSVLTSPSYLKAVAANASDISGGAAIAVTPYEISALMRISLGGNNENTVTYINDTLPSAATAGSLQSFNVTVRNDGWNVLTSLNHALLVTVDEIQKLERVSGERADWVANGFEALDRGPGTTQGIRRFLSRAGYVGKKREKVVFEQSLFPLPSDLLISDFVVIPATVQLPAIGDTTVGSLVKVSYQLAQVNANGSIMPFEQFGNIKWTTSLLIE